MARKPAVRIVIVRHAEAHPVGERDIQTDADRFLTAAGRKSARLAARTLRRLGVRPDAVWTSPLVRARETAEILRERLKGKSDLVELPALAPPGKDSAILARLRSEKPDEVILVGHEPFLGELLERLLTGRTGQGVPLSKSSVVCLDLSPRSWGEARLRWCLNVSSMKVFRK
jgi:phosphohistidine phosphatase